MITVETGHYIKGMHTLLNALFNLRHYEMFQQILKRFERFATTPSSSTHDNFRVHTFIYISAAEINWHLITGTFSKGLELVPRIEAGLQEYAVYVDLHRILIFNYKFAVLYFGSGDYNTCIDYLQRVINDHSNLRIDLQCYARLLHLMAHYELGNDTIIESLTRSVYRFMAKMKNLSVVEEEIFKFIRNSLKVSTRQMKPQLEIFLSRVKHLEKNRFETRAFSYLDVISWIESKVYEKPMSEIVHAKYLESKHRHHAKPAKALQMD